MTQGEQSSGNCSLWRGHIRGQAHPPRPHVHILIFPGCPGLSRPSSHPACLILLDHCPGRPASLPVPGAHETSAGTVRAWVWPSRACIAPFAEEETPLWGSESYSPGIGLAVTQWSGPSAEQTPGPLDSQSPSLVTESHSWAAWGAQLGKQVQAWKGGLFLDPGTW